MDLFISIKLDHAPCPHQQGIRMAGRMMFKSQKLKDTEQEIKYQIIDQLNKLRDFKVPKAESYRVELTFGYPNKVYPDLDNAAKTVLDSMQGLIIENDKLIDELILKRVKSEKGTYTITIGIDYITT